MTPIGKDDRKSAQVLFASGSLMLGGLSIALSWPHRDVAFSLGLAAVVAVAFFATRLLTTRLPQGDEVYVTLIVVVPALAITDITVVLIAYAAAAVVELMARLSHSTKDVATSRALDAVRAIAVIAWMAPSQLLLHPLTRSSAGDSLILAVLAVGVAYSLAELITISIHHWIAGGLPLAQSIEALQRPLTTMYLVHLSMAAVAVRLYAASGIWALPIALLLTLILQNSFNLYLRIRRGYSDTISTLARAAELDRPRDSGHARRVSDLAIAVGRRFGLSSRELEQLGYASLLHDIGRMGDSGDDASPVHAERGAAIVASIPFLHEVAPLILQAKSRDDEVCLSARIVRVCSHYDRLRCNLGDQSGLDTLRVESGEMDMSVTQALADVVQGKATRVGVGT